MDYFPLCIKGNTSPWPGTHSCYEINVHLETVHDTENFASGAFIDLHDFISLNDTAF